MQIPSHTASKNTNSHQPDFFLTDKPVLLFSLKIGLAIAAAQRKLILSPSDAIFMVTKLSKIMV